MTDLIQVPKLRYSQKIVYKNETQKIELKI